MSEKQVQTRKLIKWGSSKTLIMSLPRNWVKKHDLTEKDEVQVIHNVDDSLLILPARTTIVEKKSEATIVVKDELDIETTKYLVVTKYLDGWDVITLEAKRGLTFSSNYYKEIQEIIKPLLGLEVMSVLKDRVQIRDLYSVQETNIINLVRIISQNTLEFFQALIDLVENPPGENVEEAVDRIIPNREMIIKYYYRIHRELRKGLLKPASLGKMNLTPQDVLDFAFYINGINTSAENIETQLHAIKNHGLPGDLGGTEKQVIAFMKRAYKFFEQGIDAFLFKKTTDAISCLNSYSSIRDFKREVENALDQTGVNTLAFQVGLDMTEKVIDATRTIAMAALRRIA
ncbi:MAG: AbrB/MazE/SpoVT family DNA-binding domain-containing protein [Promethearchaeota archaeon]